MQSPALALFFWATHLLTAFLAALQRALCFLAILRRAYHIALMALVAAAHTGHPMRALAQPPDAATCGEPLLSNHPPLVVKPATTSLVVGDAQPGETMTAHDQPSLHVATASASEAEDAATSVQASLSNQYL
ncbi:hypothetical protein L7F22_000016 [Adiantum nelumboides]|nr:hypothetical protein [Adiantum nelumboides]